MPSLPKEGKTKNTNLIWETLEIENAVEIIPKSGLEIRPVFAKLRF